MTSISATTIVHATLWTLGFFSVLSWTVIFVKSIGQWRMSRQNRLFKERFWSAPDLSAAAQLGAQRGPAARLADAGFTMLRDVEANPGRDLEHSGDRQDLLERCLRQQLQKERGDMENGLTLLASIGSTSPFVGLFGTVWGIMHALQDITTSKSASLDVVAGPIGEALVATAIGIAVAIPAVLAYNFFVRNVKVSVADLEDFATDFLHLAIKTGFRIKRES
jgi:biopolymer transport protein ExbB